MNEEDYCLYLMVEVKEIEESNDCEMELTYHSQGVIL